MQPDNFLHTTHRTVSWFNKAYAADELELAAPFQRNPVWTEAQKSYLIDTILLGLPIPELYMQDVGDSAGNEKHIVVDGQQRMRAVLDFVHGKFVLAGEDISPAWRNSFFEDLSEAQKKTIYAYKFVVRVLPPMDHEGLRKIFSRLNRNVVSLNQQELRNATYWGPFIQSVRAVGDLAFWTSTGLFSANDHRRMLDHEFISELMVAVIHGPQNKKDNLDRYYQLYEETFEQRAEIEQTFLSATGEIAQLLPDMQRTRWRKKSDFYTLFLSLASRSTELPFNASQRKKLSRQITSLGNQVTSLLALAEEDWGSVDEHVKAYARAVSRAASDKGNRLARAKALEAFVFDSRARKPKQKKAAVKKVSKAQKKATKKAQ